jgi:hypothetical protein
MGRKPQRMRSGCIWRASTLDSHIVAWTACSYVRAIWMQGGEPPKSALLETCAVLSARKTGTTEHLVGMFKSCQSIFTSGKRTHAGDDRHL